LKFGGGERNGREPEIKSWTAKRKAAVVLEVLKGKTTELNER